jgi:hypothetical protein
VRSTGRLTVITWQVEIEPSQDITGRSLVLMPATHVLVVQRSHRVLTLARRRQRPSRGGVRGTQPVVLSGFTFANASPSASLVTSRS